MWTAEEVKSESSLYEGLIWRVVEVQSVKATARITDGDEEQRILESILEETKPPIPEDCSELDFLLFTPFRYGPEPTGSRFRRVGQEDGAFYGAESAETAIAELAFLQLLFYLESPETTLPSRPVEKTAFPVNCSASHIDLTQSPFDQKRALWEDPVDYRACQDIADIARSAELQAIRSKSVRDPDGGYNVTLLTPMAFSGDIEQGELARNAQTWTIFIRDKTVQVWREFPRHSREYLWTDLGNDPRVVSEN